METKPETQNYWRECDARLVLAELEASGLRLAAFCRQRGLSSQRLRLWRNRLAATAGAGKQRPPAPALTLLPVRITSGRSTVPAKAAMASSQSPFELSLGDCRTLRVPCDFSAEARARLLGVLESSRC